MALSSATVWEVRTTGSDTQCGGGFVAGATGTDYSQQNAAQFSGTDLVVDAVSNTKVSSATHNFVGADVGNVIQITAGAGWTTGFYEIVSVLLNAATLDRSPAATGTTGGTWWEGGALASPGMAAGAKAASNTVYIKAGTYTISTTTGNVSGGKVADILAGVWEGYQTTRGDLGTAPLLQVAASGVTSITIFSSTSASAVVRNLAVDGLSKASIRGVTLTAVGWGYRLKASNCTNVGLLTGRYVYCTVTGCSTVRAMDATFAYGCVSYSNTGVEGFGNFTTDGAYVRCLAYGNGTQGFLMGTDCHLAHCTSYGNTLDGFRITAANRADLVNCLAVGNGGFGFGTNAVARAYVMLQTCAGYNNTSGNVDTTNLVNNFGFLTLSADPFVNAGTDFGLNTTAGGGAVLRAAGGTFFDVSTTNAIDIGAAQHLVLVLLAMAAQLIFANAIDTN